MTYAQLITYVDNWIKTNANEEITALVLNDVLKEIMKFDWTNYQTSEVTLNIIDLRLSDVESNYKDNFQIEINSDTVANVSWNGKNVIVNSDAKITIPATIPANWTCDFITLETVNLTLDSVSPKTWLFGAPSVVTEKKKVTVMQRGNTNSLILI